MPDSTLAAPAAPTVRVFNRTARTFIHGPHNVVPNAFTTVPADVGEKLMTMFPDQVVEAGIAQKEINGVAIEAAELRGKVAEQEKTIADLRGKVAEQEKTIADLQAKLGKKGTDSQVKALQAEIAELKTMLDTI